MKKHFLSYGYHFLLFSFIYLFFFTLSLILHFIASNLFLVASPVIACVSPKIFSFVHCLTLLPHSYCFASFKSLFMFSSHSNPFTLSAFIFLSPILLRQFFPYYRLYNFSLYMIWNFRFLSFSLTLHLNHFLLLLTLLPLIPPQHHPVLSNFNYFLHVHHHHHPSLYFYRSNFTQSSKYQVFLHPPPLFDLPLLY